jgi:signal transduction histidine kinase
VDVAYELTPLVASKLIVYTFGTLVHLFLMVLILGNRRMQRLEWLLFALMSALFMWNSGNLLALNIGLFYGFGPRIPIGFARLIAFTGLLVAPPLVVHIHAEYLARYRVSIPGLRLLVAAFYFPLIAAPWLLDDLLGHVELEPIVALGSGVHALVEWMVAALFLAVSLNAYLAIYRWSATTALVKFHGWTAGVLGFFAIGLVWAFLWKPLPLAGLGGYFATFLMLVAVAPSGWMGYWIFRHNFLDLRVQRNVVYSVAAIFGLLIYLNFMRRLSGYLEIHEILPAAVTEGVMIFVLVIFLEPVKKLINRALHAAFVSEFEKVQKLGAEIQDCAKQSGDLEALRRYVQERVAGELGLERLSLTMGRRHLEVVHPSKPSKTRIVPIYRGNEVVAFLEIVPVTAEISGDQLAALQMLTDQLAAALELCQLIADKVKLERELAEKAKMAFLGEMAARIAHNVKNPLSSMKTLVQLLEEDASLPERVRQDCRMVVAEINRLNHNISQLLRYAKPARDTDRSVDLAAVVGRVSALAKAEAERRNVRLEVEAQNPCPVEGGEEAANDIVSNLVVNALEASSAGDTVRICVSRNPATITRIELSVEDEGKGIPTELKEKVFQPFFTTRPGGTGLGLSIVTRRLEEIGGSVECLSPSNGTGFNKSAGQKPGARFVVRFRAAKA